MEDRNVTGLGKFSTTERYLNGHAVSLAELKRHEQHQVTRDHVQGVRRSAEERGSTPYVAKHWHWQPVGGRLENAASARMNTASAAAAKRNQSSVDMVVFGREQDGGSAEGGPNKQIAAGRKKAVGALSSQNSVVDNIVFGSDKDGFNGVSDLEAAMKTMPEFSQAAGVYSWKMDANSHETTNLSDPKMAQLKNASSVDTVVFNRDVDNSSSSGVEPHEAFENDPAIFGGAGGLSSTKVNRTSTMDVSGFPGQRLKRSIEVNSAVQETPTDGSRAQQRAGSRLYQGAAGADSAIFDRGVSVPNKQGERPKDHLLNGSGKVQQEEAAAIHQPPVLSRVHLYGSMASVLSGVPACAENRERLGVGKSDGTRLGDREEQRRMQLSQGCRSLEYTSSPHFKGAAGMPSDQQYFACSSDIVRRIKPLTRDVGYSNRTDVDMVVFGHDLEGKASDFDLRKDEAFFKAAGAESGSDFRPTAKQAVPQELDHMDEIILGRELQVSDEQQSRKQRFEAMNQGRLGQGTHQAEAKSFDSRLQASGVVGVQPKVRQCEPEGELKGPLHTPDYPPKHSSVGAAGAPRNILGHSECAQSYVPDSRGQPIRVRSRHDLDSSDMQSALQPESGVRERHDITVPVPEVMASAAGVVMRQLNDYDAGLIADVDTTEETKQAAKNWGSEDVSAALSGEGFQERQTEVVRRKANDEYAWLREEAAADHVSSYNLLRPDQNEGKPVRSKWTPHPTEVKIFNRGKPYGLDRLSPSEMYITEATHTNERVRSMTSQLWQGQPKQPAPVVTSDSSKPPLGPASEKAEAWGATRQSSERSVAPFAVDETSCNYETSSQASSGAYHESMAARIARRRLMARSDSRERREFALARR